MRFIVVSVSLEEVPVQEFRFASVGVVSQVLHTHLWGSVTRTNGRRLGACQKAISEIRLYLMEENCHLIFKVLTRKPWECRSHVTRP